MQCVAMCCSVLQVCCRCVAGVLQVCCRMMQCVMQKRGANMRTHSPKIETSSWEAGGNILEEMSNVEIRVVTFVWD